MRVPAAAIFGGSAILATTAVSLYFAGVRRSKHDSEPFAAAKVPVARIETPRAEEHRNAEGTTILEGRDLNVRIAATTAVGADDAHALEVRWDRAPGTRERLEIAADLAAENDQEAVRVIGRLLSIERHPELKRALLSSLAEIDPSIAVEERLVIVQSAVRSSSPQLRAIALAALDALDDPRVTPLLTQLSREDPDSTVRIVAAKMRRARAETEAALTDKHRK